MSLQYTSYFIGGGGENIKAASLLFTMQILELGSQDFSSIKC